MDSHSLTLTHAHTHARLHLTAIMWTQYWREINSNTHLLTVTHTRTFAPDSNNVDPIREKWILHSLTRTLTHTYSHNAHLLAIIHAHVREPDHCKHSAGARWVKIAHLFLTRNVYKICKHERF